MLNKQGGSHSLIYGQPKKHKMKLPILLFLLLCTRALAIINVRMLQRSGALFLKSAGPKVFVVAERYVNVYTINDLEVLLDGSMEILSGATDICSSGIFTADGPLTYKYDPAHAFDTNYTGLDWQSVSLEIPLHHVSCTAATSTLLLNHEYLYDVRTHALHHLGVRAKASHISDTWAVVVSQDDHIHVYTHGGAHVRTIPPRSEYAYGSNARVEQDHLVVDLVHPLTHESVGFLVQDLTRATAPRSLVREESACSTYALNAEYILCTATKNSYGYVVLISLNTLEVVLEFRLEGARALGLLETQEALRMYTVHAEEARVYLLREGVQPNPPVVNWQFREPAPQWPPEVEY